MSFRCREHCSDCCGPVPFPDATVTKHERLIVRERERVRLHGEMVILCEDGLCPFLDREDVQDKCRIYSDRPRLCRDYGLSDEMPCPWMKPNGKPRSEAMVKRTQRRINHDVDSRIRRVMEATR